MNSNEERLLRQVAATSRHVDDAHREILELERARAREALYAHETGVPVPMLAEAVGQSADAVERWLEAARVSRDAERSPRNHLRH